MIKINLLGVAPPPSKLSSSGAPATPTATLAMVFVGALIVCFGVVGVIYKVWSNRIADFEHRRNREKIRQTELQAVKAQNAKYQQRLKDLETRINTIQALQNSRVGPVELMGSLGNIVNKTNDLYLYTLSPSGERFDLKGQTNTVDSMASFLAFLKSSGNFDAIQLDQFYQDDIKERLTYKFSVSCAFKTVGGAPSPTAGAAPEAGGPPGPASAGGPVKGPSVPQGMVGAPAQVQQSLKHGM